MRRRLFNLAAAVSMGLCAVVVAVGMVSSVRLMTAGRSSVTTGPGGSVYRGWTIGAVHGTLLAGYTRFFTAPGLARVRWSARADEASTFPRFGHGGFHWQRDVSPASSIYQVAVPGWLVAMLLAILPGVWLRDRRRRRRLKDRDGVARCVRCGYDLRATPGRCPECGTVVDAAG